MKEHYKFSTVLGAVILALRPLLAPDERAEGETRAYDVGSIVAPVRNVPFILEPEGFLFLGTIRRDSSLSDGIPHFGPEERAPAGSGEASEPFPATVSSLIPLAIVERADPETMTCGDGIELRAAATFADGGERVRLKVEGGEARILEERKVTASFPATPYASGPGSTPDGTASGPQAPVPATRGADVIKKIKLTLPRQRAQYWQSEVEVPLGRDAILRTEVREGEPATVLLGRVRAVQ